MQSVAANCVTPRFVRNWSVSWTTSTAYDGAILHVARHYKLADRYVIAHGDHDGRKFATSDEAAAFALERGYCQRYFTSPDLRARRVARGAETYEQRLAWRAANGYDPHGRKIN